MLDRSVYPYINNQVFFEGSFAINKYVSYINLEFSL